MNNSTKHDISDDKSITSNRVGVRFAMLHIPLAGALSVTMGCLPPTPPSAAQIFSPSPGFFFQQTTGDVGVNGLMGAVCYTTDGSFPSYNAGTCSGGTTETYAGNIELACEAGETGAAQKTATIVYVFNGVETSSAASYSILCPVASNVTVFSVLGTGTISGQYPGNISVTGSAALNTDTGVLNFNFSTTSITAFTNITSEESGAIEGAWGEPLIASPLGTITVGKCTNNGGLANACDYVVLDTPSDMGITLASDPIDFDLSAAGVTEFSIFVARVPPAIPVAADTAINYTLTTLGAGSESTWYQDSDGDGYGDVTLPLDDVIQPNGYVADATDCDDDDASRFPGNPEVCDGVDNDCDSIVPAGEADDDADNYLVCAGFVSSSDDSVLGGDDCNDDVTTGGNINPGITETADLVDEDCDGEVDNGFKYIFVSSGTTTGNLAHYDTGARPDQGSPGLDGADEFCQKHADGVYADVYGASIVPSGTYKAWLSDPTAHAVNRMSNTGLPYVNMVGNEIAADRNALVDMTHLAAPIGHYETGTVVTQPPQAWTGTTQKGLLFGLPNDRHCNGWTDGSSAGLALAGWPGYLNTYWTYWAERTCDFAGVSLYCVQQ